MYFTVSETKSARLDGPQMFDHWQGPHGGWYHNDGVLARAITQ